MSNERGNESGKNIVYEQLTTLVQWPERINSLSATKPNRKGPTKTISICKSDFKAHSYFVPMEAWKGPRSRPALIWMCLVCRLCSFILHVYTLYTFMLFFLFLSFRLVCIHLFVLCAVCCDRSNGCRGMIECVIVALVIQFCFGNWNFALKYDVGCWILLLKISFDSPV